MARETAQLGAIRSRAALRGFIRTGDPARQGLHRRHRRGDRLRRRSALEPDHPRLRTPPAARGNSRILSPGGARVQAPQAAFANGALAHAFEMDNLTWPNTGVHPGATMFAPALAIAQERGIGGRELIAAFVAGAEVMIRIGRATQHNNEGRGFHAPGTTGPFGGAVAVGRLLKFDAGADDQRARDRGFARLRAPGVRALRHRRDGQAPAHGARGRERRARGKPCRGRLHRAGHGAGRPVRIPQRLLRRARPARADARTRLGIRDAAHHAQALSGAHHLAHVGASGRGPAARASAMRARTSPRSISPAIRRWRPSTTSRRLPT